MARPDARDAITDEQLRALHSLADRQPGRDANFVNIAAAQGLAARGLARHNGGGWVITPEGRNYLLHAAAVDSVIGAANKD